jgi:endo-1,4-beta-mannosidase
MKKVQDLKSLKKFSKLYKDYKILDFDGGNINKEDFEKNTKLILSSLQHLVPIIEEFDSTTPTTQITFQVITEGFVTEKEFTDVQLNIKRWQQVTKLSGGSDQLNRILSMLTGSH